MDKLKALERDPNAAPSVEQPQSPNEGTASTSGTQDKQGGGSVTLALESEVARIESDKITLKDARGERTLDNDFVFTMIGREAPLGFFRRSGLPIRNEWTW